MTENQQYHRATLPNGLRMVVCRFPGAVSYIGVAVGAGSRDEAPDREGLAHFVEHTVFKGTRRRRSWQISSRMEQIGGELNAYTTKEETLIYTNAPAGYEERALDLLSDLIRNSIFPSPEIDREREVIVEEIKSYEDSPSENVYDLFEENAYAGSPLAHNILGSAESVRNLSGRDAREFIDRWYNPANMVVYCFSPEKPEKLLRLVEKYFAGLDFPAFRRSPSEVKMPEPFDLTEDADNQQANTIMGARVFSRHDPRRYSLFLLNNYLGGPCMNSRLNMELRERRGLVYTVDGNVSLMSDAGLILFYFGTDPTSVERCSSIIRREIERLASSALPEKTFARVRDQYCGQMIVGSDHRESRAMSLAKSILYFDEILDIDYTTDRIREVTPEQLRQTAELILSNGLNRLTIR